MTTAQRRMTPRMISMFDALIAEGWTKRDAARELGIGLTTVHKMLRTRKSPVELPQPGEMALQVPTSLNPYPTHPPQAYQAPPA